jgi:heme-degrading monooxygenase HmoA
MGEAYSSGVWIVVPGREDEFIAAWEAFASWSLREVPGARWATLLRDRSQANRFVSIGPWESLEHMEAWRSHPGFAERVAGMRPLIERLEPSTLQAVAEVGTAPRG